MRGEYLSLAARHLKLAAGLEVGEKSSNQQAREKVRVRRRFMDLGLTRVGSLEGVTEDRS